MSTTPKLNTICNGTVKADKIEKLSPLEVMRISAEQHRQCATDPAKMQCICGRTLPVAFLFKCLYCGIWYCQKCAEIHFGETREEYLTRTGAPRLPPLSK